LALGFAIFRLAKRRTGAAGAMARHALREGMADNADPARKGHNVALAGRGTAAEVIADLQAKLPAKRRKDSVTCLEFFVGMSPEDGARMSIQQQDAYFKRSLEFIGQRFGGAANIVLAVVHRDETTPHMQVLAVPLVDGKLNAKMLVGNRGHLQQLQTDFAEACGRPAGLLRGVKGSQAKHTSIKAFYGAIQAAGGASALPPRIEVPPEPSALDYIKGNAQAINDARQKALKANENRQSTIESLARVGFSARGYQARSAGVTLAKARDAQEKAEVSKVAADRAWSKANEMLWKLKEEASKVGQVVDLDALKDHAHQLDKPARPILKPTRGYSP
jgi:hypothetical protein